MKRFARLTGLLLCLALVFGAVVGLVSCFGGELDGVRAFDWGGAMLISRKNVKVTSRYRLKGYEEVDGVREEYYSTEWDDSLTYIFGGGVCYRYSGDGSGDYNARYYTVENGEFYEYYSYLSSNDGSVIWEKNVISESEYDLAIGNFDEFAYHFEKFTYNSKVGGFVCDEFTLTLPDRTVTLRNIVVEVDLKTDNGRVTKISYDYERPEWEDVVAYEFEFDYSDVAMPALPTIADGDNGIDEEMWRAAFDFGDNYRVTGQYKTDSIAGVIDISVDGDIYSSDTGNFRHDIEYYEKSGNNYYIYTYDEYKDGYVKSSINKRTYDYSNYATVLLLISEYSSDFSAAGDGMYCAERIVSTDDTSSAYDIEFFDVTVVIIDGRVSHVRYDAITNSGSVSVTVDMQYGGANVTLPEVKTEPEPPVDTGMSADEWNDALQFGRMNVTLTGNSWIVGAPMTSGTPWSMSIYDRIIRVVGIDGNTVYYSIGTGNGDYPVWYKYTYDGALPDAGYLRTEITADEYQSVQYSFDFFYGLREYFEYDPESRQYTADRVIVSIGGENVTLTEVCITADSGNGITSLEYVVGGESTATRSHIDVSYGESVTLPGWHDPIIDTGLSSDEWDNAFDLSDINNRILQAVISGDSMVEISVTRYGNIMYVSANGVDMYYDGSYTYTCTDGVWYKVPAESFEYSAVFTAYMMFCGMRDSFEYDPETGIYHADSLTITTGSDSTTLENVNITFTDGGKMLTLSYTHTESGMEIDVAVDYAPAEPVLPDAKEPPKVDDKNLTADEWEAMLDFTDRNYTYTRDFIKDGNTAFDIRYDKYGENMYVETSTLRNYYIYNPQDGTWKSYLYIDSLGKWYPSSAVTSNPYKQVVDAFEITYLGIFRGQRDSFVYDEERGGYYAAEMTTTEPDGSTSYIRDVVIKVENGRIIGITYSSYNENAGEENIESTILTITYDIDEITAPA